VATQEEHKDLMVFRVETGIFSKQNCLHFKNFFNSSPMSLAVLKGKFVVYAASHKRVHEYCS